MVEAMDEAVRERGRPFLGICVGMQLLADAGEEHGRHAGLGWIGGTVRAARARRSGAQGAAHGLERRRRRRAASADRAAARPIFSTATRSTWRTRRDLAATTDHGGPVTAAVARDTIVGVQFHPEKSQAYGLAFLARFLEWRP